MRKWNVVKKAAAICLIQVLAFAGAAAGLGGSIAKAEERRAPLVADAAMYRGSVTEIWEEKGSVHFQLRQEQGTEFGAASKRFHSDANSYFDGKLTDVREGDYLEVYYGAGEESKANESEYAISIGRLYNASFSIFNGEVVEITKEGNSGSILLKQLETETQVLFRYSESTQVYLNMDSVKKGDKLNIYYNGIQTRSIPGQANASEIRAYYGNSIYRGTIEAMAKKGSITTLTLKKAEGTPFAQEYKVNLKESSRSELALDSYKKGDYVEVAYKTPKKAVTIPTAKSIEKLFEPEMTVFTGSLTSIEKDEKDENRGTLVMKGVNGEEMLFHYAFLTSFATDLSQLKAGDKLSIYHRGIMTLSLPPQGSALEVSLFQK